MGTPDFAKGVLQEIINSVNEVVAVVTAPDRPAGRGQKIRKSAVKLHAEINDIPILQPEKLKADAFISDLKGLDADLFVVVAFRMLPEVVWSIPPKGTINLHASLLPNYRGAAPINWATRCKQDTIMLCSQSFKLENCSLNLSCKTSGEDSRILKPSSVIFKY